jgi:hypothetical protein
MSDRENWIYRFEQELDRGEAARLAGNEGMARVCARRAAGIVVEEHFRRRGEQIATASAYDYLRYLSTIPGTSPDVLTAAEHFLVRITPEYTLPVDADLLAEARWLRSRLLEEAAL